MNSLKKYLKIWWIFTTRASQVAFSSRVGAILFIFGKIFRFIFFIFFIFILTSKIKTISGYNFWQVIFFFATYNLVDTLAQFFLREVYNFRSYVVLGYFDYILTKPISSLFRSLFGGSDVLDLSILFASIAVIIFSASKIENIFFINIVLYLLLIINAFMIALAFHIFVLGVGILTTSVDNMIMLYRDVTNMGRFPVDIYKEPARGFLTFVIPIGIMMTMPAKVMMGILSFQFVFIAFIVGILFFILSLRFWGFSLKHYSSASS